MKAIEKNALIRTMNTAIKTLGDLKKSAYQSKDIKTELRDNLIASLNSGKKTFEGMHGYEQTVIPQLERAILSKHNINLLGLRGQGKTRIARLMIQLLDEYIPVVAGSEINDDPLKPISRFAKDLIAEKLDYSTIIMQMSIIKKIDFVNLIIENDIITESLTILLKSRIVNNFLFKNLLLLDNSFPFVLRLVVCINDDDNSTDIFDVLFLNKLDQLIP